MEKFDDSDVAEVFFNYPENMQERLNFLRHLILDTASEIESVGTVIESLKWGEPSYSSKRGSTIRIDWKKSKPDHYAIYFNCNTKLIESFKTLYSDVFKFDGKRAIIFHKDDEIPIEKLKHCISLSLTYHRIKHLPMLGV